MRKAQTNQATAATRDLNQQRLRRGILDGLPDKLNNRSNELASDRGEIQNVRRKLLTFLDKTIELADFNELEGLDQLKSGTDSRRLV